MKIIATNMKCNYDVKLDIIDKISKDLTTGGLFRKGPTKDTLIYPQSSPASENTVKIVTEGINRRFKEDLMSYSKVGEFFTIKINPSDQLIDNYLQRYEENTALKSFNDIHNEFYAEEQKERGYNIDNTGPNTEQLLHLAPAEESVGVFNKFLRHKERLISFLNQRLGQINKELKNPKTTVERRTELNDLRLKIKIRLNGDPARGISGLIQEVSEIRKTSNIDAVGYYVEQDLKRLESLIKSPNMTAIDIKEAQTLIEFYDAAGTFHSNEDNPFFPQQEIFFYTEEGAPTPDYKLGEEMMAQFKQWRNIAMGFAPAVDLKAKEITTNTFNADQGVEKTFNREFNFDQIVFTKQGLKDVDWVTAWAMDVTQAIFSKSAPLAQVMHSYLVNSMETHLNYSRDYAKRMEELSPEVTKRLGEIEGGKYKLRAFGIIGVNGVSYDLYLDNTKDGMKTGTLVQRFTKEYVDAQVDQAERFSKEFEKARLADENVRPIFFNTAFEQGKSWKRANNVIMNPSLIEEIINKPEFAEFNTKASAAEIAAHKAELINLLGERGYTQEVARQEKMINRFLADRQSYINAQITFEGVADEDSLSANSKFLVKQWDLQHNPLRGVQDYYSGTGLIVDKRKINTYMDYNNLIPRAFKPKVTVVNGVYSFEDTTIPTGYYNDKFKTIEQDNVLRNFYNLVKEGIDKITESAPYEIQKTMAANTLPMLMKSTAEFLIDNRNNTLKMVSSAWRRLWDRIRLSFGLIQQSEISYAVKDPITGRYNYKINDQFLQGNQRAIKDRMVIEKIKFSQAYNLGSGPNIGLINRFTVVPLSNMNPSALAHLAQLLSVEISMSEINAGKIDKIKAITGNKVEIGKIIRNFSVHSVVQAQSFDLPKLMKHFTNLAMAYSARTESLPIMEIMKSHYEQIKNPKTQNTGISIFNVPEDAIASEEGRKRAIEQMEDWFQRVMLDNYSIKHWKPFGFNIEQSINKDTKELKTKIPLIGEKLFTSEERKKIEEIDKLMTEALKAKNDEQYNQLKAIKDKLGKTRVASAAILNFLDMIRTLKLGWNLSSGVINLAEGYTSNMILASGGEFFNPEEIYYGYSLVKHSWVKNLTFGRATTKKAKKARLLMDRYNVLLDSRNELQKSSTKTNLSKLETLNPYHINARIEFINQMPIMVAMLRTQLIKDREGNEVSVWDAMDSDGNLEEQYRTEENINNWEKLTGKEYLVFKNKMNEAIVRGHGNYDELRGMMVKSNLAGKALMMFKTWLPAQIYWRFAQEQENLKTGKVTKGRFRSFTPGSAAIYGAGLGFIAFGPLGLAVGGGSYLAGKLFGVQTELGALKEMFLTTQALFKKAIGMPVNIISGRNLIKSEDDFSKWVGSGKFTQLDARNLRGNMAELSIVMTSLLLMLLVKSFFWDDDDTPEDPERQFHNIAVNKLMQLMEQASMYVNPANLWKSSIGDLAIWKFLQDGAKEVDKLRELSEGLDPGGSKTLRQTKKMFVPGLFKDNILGFSSQAEKQFNPSPFDNWFKGEDVILAKKEKLIRANRIEELKELGYEDQGQRTKIINIEYPTTRQLEKKGYTREEWNELNEDFELPELVDKDKEDEDEDEE